VVDLRQKASATEHGHRPLVLCVLHIGVLSTSANKISNAKTHSYITTAKGVMFLTAFV